MNAHEQARRSLPDGHTLRSAYALIMGDGTVECGRPTKNTGKPCRARIQVRYPACPAHRTAEERDEVARLDAELDAERAKIQQWLDAAEPACWSWQVREVDRDADPVDVLVEWQAERCAICGGRQARQVWDHDHATDLVRGLLCVSCNSKEPGGVGVFDRYRERPPTAILGIEIEHFGFPALGTSATSWRLEDDPSDLVAAAIE